MLAPAAQIPALLAELDKATKEGLPTAKFIPALGFNIVSAYIVRNAPVAEVEEFLSKHQARLTNVVFSELRERNLPKLIVKHNPYPDASAATATGDFSKFEAKIIKENWKEDPDRYLDLLRDFNTADPSISQACKDWVYVKMQEFNKLAPSSITLRGSLLDKQSPELLTLLHERLPPYERDELIGWLKIKHKPLPEILTSGEPPKSSAYYRILLSSKEPVLQAEALQNFDYRNPIHYAGRTPEEIETAKTAFRTNFISQGSRLFQGPDQSPIIKYYLKNGDTPESLKQLASETGSFTILNYLNGVPEPTLRKDWTSIPPGTVLNDHEQNARWKALNGPEPWLFTKEECPLGFKPNLFKELLPITSSLAVSEGDNYAAGNQGERYAFKLAVLFSNSQEALQFIDKHKNRQSEQPVHDLLQHPLPEVAFAKDKWKGFIQKFGGPALELLTWAPYLDRDPSFTPTSLTQVRAAAAQIGYKRESENPKLAQLAMVHKLPEATYDTYADLIKVAQPEKTLPKLEFEIKEGNNTYKWRMLSPKDPEFYVVGENTDCCMRHKYAGYSCLVHAATQPNSCMYALENVTNPAKPVVEGVTWAWRGKANEIVLDSWERKKRSPVADLALKTFSAKAGVPVYLGKGGAGGKDFSYARADVKPVLENPPSYMTDSNMGVYEVPKLTVERAVSKDKARELVGMDR